MEQLKEKQTIQDRVLEESRNGYVVVADIEGLSRCLLSEFIQQPANGILYDLNRLEEVVLTFIDDPKWVNDFAVAKTIRALKDKIDDLKTLADREPKWVAIKSEADAPKEFGRVLVQDANRAIYTYHFDLDAPDEVRHFCGRFVAWMPLPEPYKQEN